MDIKISFDGGVKVNASAGEYINKTDQPLESGEEVSQSFIKISEFVFC